MFSRWVSGLLCACACGSMRAAPPAKAVPACRRAVAEGEVRYGEPFVKAIGGGLNFYLQPIASGWIVRVLPAAGLKGDHDYAELATPPYQSITPLSLSTDFAFRAQDAVGWNPRRFRFATSETAFHALEAAYLNFEQAGATPPAPVQVELSNQISQASEGTLTILDARLIPGTADQWRMAATVASHFLSTAHTLVAPVEGQATPLGKLLWVRFRVGLDEPAKFVAAPGWRLVPQNCGNP